MGAQILVSARSAAHAHGVPHAAHQVHANLMYASLFYCGGSVMGEARPKLSAVHLKDAILHNGLCRGTRIAISDSALYFDY